MSLTMERVYDTATFIFDPLHEFWESDQTQRRVGGLLVIVFLLALAAIELNRHALLPASLAQHAPTSHFAAVGLAFSLVLILEVVSFIFTLPCSITKSVGKQFEILALILLRSTFKELVHFPEPITLQGHMDSLLRIISDGSGALAIFLILGLYYALQRKNRKELKDPVLRYKFVASKKIVALVILGVFIAMGCRDLLGILRHHPPTDFFAAFYTVLIFSDILIVLISQRHLPAFRAVFRNSGFALATLLIRIALTAPPYYNSAIGVGAALFAICLSLVYDRFYARPLD